MVGRRPVQAAKQSHLIPLCQAQCGQLFPEPKRPSFTHELQLDTRLRASESTARKKPYRSSGKLKLDHQASCCAAHASREGTYAVHFSAEVAKQIYKPARFRPKEVFRSG